MILAKVRVTARNEEDDAALREFTTYVAADTAEQVSTVAIQRAHYQVPELDSSAVRFEVATLASVNVPPGNRLAAKQRAALVDFLEKNAPNTLSEELDDWVHDLVAEEASRINNGGLSGQLDYLVGQLSTDEMTHRFCNLLMEG